MSGIVERLRNRIHDAPMPTEHLLDEAADTITDLLDALVEAEKQFGPFADITINGKHDADDVRVVGLVRAAIAKAKGGAA